MTEQPQLPKGGSDPKLHHIVAKFLLWRFAADGKLELVDRENFDRMIPSTPLKALAENHFYSIETDEGRDPIAETELSQRVDDSGADALRQIIDKRRPLAAPAWRETISVFLAFQFVRGPRMRYALVEHGKLCARKMASFATPERILESSLKRGEEMTPEEAAGVADFAQKGEYTIDVKRKANLHLSVAIPSVPETVLFFHRRTWRVFEFAEPCLITSDEPVALIGADETEPGTAGGLIGAHRVVFPVDPRHALVLFRPDLANDEGWFRGDAALAGVINRHVAFTAHRWIVRTPGINPLAGMALPEMAPPAFEVGSLIGLSPNASVKDRAKTIERARRWEEKHRR